MRACSAVERAAARRSLRASRRTIVDCHRPSGYLFISSSERRARERRAAAPGHRLDRERQLARRHAPECVGRQPQDAEPEADRLAARGTAAAVGLTPRPAAALKGAAASPLRRRRRRSRRSDRRRCAHSRRRRRRPPCARPRRRSPPRPRRAGRRAMMRMRSRALSRPVPKRSASATRSSAPNAASSSASAPSVSTRRRRAPPISASISPR